MIRIRDIVLSLDQDESELEKLIAGKLKEKPLHWQIVKRSLDARKKDKICYHYTIDAAVQDEKKWKNRNRDKNMECVQNVHYQFPNPGEEKLEYPPVVIGMGPAGLLCGLMLARKGYHPLILEQGAPVEERQKDVRKFWKTGELEPFSNVQFGEGGAGTFSDGKLNTQIKDKSGRIHRVLEIFVKAGAQKSILYDAKPHIGTDVLAQVVVNIRKEILAAGGKVLFHHQLEDLVLEDGRLQGIRICNLQTKEMSVIRTNTAVLAIGHSARKTFYMLNEYPIDMQAKSFAVGVRIQHPQEEINRIQYGPDHSKVLPAADYKLTAKAEDGRGVYSFCMCPGGQVVNASSEEGRLAVNGMSYAARDGKNANSALIVSVTPEDYPSDSVLAGIEFQRKLEAAAWKAGEGRIPVQLWKDFKRKKKSEALGAVWPDMGGEWCLANTAEALPDFICRALEDAMPQFEQKMHGFDREDALIAGTESRTSSPVRILRDDLYESSVRGLYPCGEGAGYAGGITSAAVDGLKVAEQIVRRYSVPEKREINLEFNKEK